MQPHIDLEIKDKLVPLPHKLGNINKGELDVRVNVIVNGENLINFNEPQKQKTTKENTEIENDDMQLH